MGTSVKIVSAIRKGGALGTHILYIPVVSHVVGKSTLGKHD